MKGVAEKLQRSHARRKENERGNYEEVRFKSLFRGLGKKRKELYNNLGSLE